MLEAVIFDVAGMMVDSNDLSGLLERYDESPPATGRAVGIGAKGRAGVA